MSDLVCEREAVPPFLTIEGVLQHSGEALDVRHHAGPEPALPSRDFFAEETLAQAAQQAGPRLVPIRLIATRRGG
jgi:hypothetical protein